MGRRRRVALPVAEDPRSRELSGGEGCMSPRVVSFLLAYGLATCSLLVVPGRIDASTGDVIPRTGGGTVSGIEVNMATLPSVAVATRATVPLLRTIPGPASSVGRQSLPAAARPQRTSPRGLMALATTATQDVAIGTTFMGRSQAGSVVPPDPQVAVGPSDVVELVNVAGSIYDRTGIARKSFTLADFFLAGSDLLSDPRIVYDSGSGRFLASILDVSIRSVIVAVSTSADPRGTWWHYEIPADIPGNCPDQPKLGISDAAVVVTANAYAATACTGDTAASFIGAKVWVLDKSALVAGTPVAWSNFGPEAAYGGLAPTVAESSTDTVYLVGADAVDPYSLHLFEVVGGPSSSLQIPGSLVALSAPIGDPPLAVQRGSAVALTGNDARAHDAVYAAGRIAVGFDVSCTPPGDTIVHACAAIYELAPGGTVTAAGSAAFTGEDTYYPAFRFDSASNLVVAIGHSSSQVYPGLAVAVLRADGTWSDSTIDAVPGTGPVTDPSGRYGDYFGAAVDPADPNSIWFAGEVAAVGGMGRWGTAIFSARYSAAPPAAPAGTPPAAIPTVNSVLAGESVTLYQRATAGQAVGWESSPDGLVWTQLGTSIADVATGEAMFTFAPTATVLYRTTIGGLASPPVRVVVLPPLSSSFVTTVSPTVVTWGALVAVSATLVPAIAPPDNHAFVLLSSSDDRVWTPAGVAATDSLGRATFLVHPSVNTRYRVVATGEGMLTAGTSNVVSVVVRATAILRPVGPISATLGRSATFAATVRPLGAGMPVTWRLYIWSGSRWIPSLSAKGTTDASGIARWIVTFRGSGRWGVRVAPLATGTTAAGPLTPMTVVVVA